MQEVAAPGLKSPSNQEVQAEPLSGHTARTHWQKQYLTIQGIQGILGTPDWGTMGFVQYKSMCVSYYQAIKPLYDTCCKPDPTLLIPVSMCYHLVQWSHQSQGRY